MSEEELFDQLRDIGFLYKVRLNPSVIDADIFVLLYFKAEEAAGDLFIGTEKTEYYKSIEEWCYRVIPSETDEWKGFKFCHAQYRDEYLVITLQYTERDRYSNPDELTKIMSNLFIMEQQ